MHAGNGRNLQPTKRRNLTVKLLLTLFFLVVVGYTLFDMVRQYMAETGSTGDRWKAAFRHSLTLLVTRVAQLSIGGLGVAAGLADLLGASGAAATLQGIFPPDYAPFFAAGVAFLGEIARRRTLPQPPAQ